MQQSRTTIIPYIFGDGIAQDIMPEMMRTLDAVMHYIYGASHVLRWMPLTLGYDITPTGDIIFEDDALRVIRQEGYCIKGPLSTPIGYGMRSLNVALRRALDTYANIRPAYYMTGAPSPLIHPEDVHAIIVRELTEDTYCGYDYPQDSPEVHKLFACLKLHHDPASTGAGIKISSKYAAERLVLQALDVVFKHKRSTITFVHKGNIMKYTEGSFFLWSMEALKAHPDVVCIDDKRFAYKGHSFEVNNILADAFFNALLNYPGSFDVIVTTNVNGDYISDAMAGMVGGLGIMPGANIGDNIVVYEAAHGSAPALAGLDKANPVAMILSASMLLRDIGLHEAADYINAMIEYAFAQKVMTYDLCRHNNKDVKPVSTRQFCHYLRENIHSAQSTKR